MENTALCWIRRDLRLHDHAALSRALAENDHVHLAFVFDSHILGKLEKDDRRITFIVESLREIESRLQKLGASLHVLRGGPVEEIPRLAQTLGVGAVYANRDYEPYAKKRDEAVARALESHGIPFHTFKDAVIFEKHEVLTGSGETYKVFTPYKNKWREKLFEQMGQLPSFTCSSKHLARWKNPDNILAIDWFERLGFIPTSNSISGGGQAGLKRLRHFQTQMSHYQETRDIPSIDGTSNLSVHLRHGTVSVRDMVRAALNEKSQGGQTWLSEIVWRDFYQMILDAHPHIERGSFKPAYDKIQWRGKDAWFEAWREGRTGFPLVDAGMRCLAQTGMLPNRLRMVTASFLCKTLLIDWRRGEKYFASQLLDYDLAANNGGWQWCSSSGCDAQPYFRIFNPWTQSEKFDPEGVFIKAWVPELAHLAAPEVHRPSIQAAPDYPPPIVVYEKTRQEALQMYATIKA